MMADLLKNTVISLRQSLVYTLSLGDKELFHSNVLGWLLERGKSAEAVANLFVPADAAITKVAREVKLGEHVQLDLLVTCTAGAEEHAVVIENKFKSMPDKAQLERYAALCEKKRIAGGRPAFILFAPRASIQAFGDSLPESWKTVSYEDLLESLSDVSFLPEEAEADFARSFVASYKTLLEALLHILNLTVLSASKDESPYTPDSETSRLLKDIRFHDVYEKLYVSTVFHTLGIAEKPHWKKETVYFHGGGLKWTYRPPESRVAWGIEIQNGRFIVFAETADKTRLTTSEAELKETFSRLLRLCFDEKSIAVKKDDKLNQYYGGIYKYQYAKLEKNFTIQELRNSMVTVMTAIEGL